MCQDKPTGAVAKQCTVLIVGAVQVNERFYLL